MFNLPIPRYDSKIKLHRDLAAAAEKAEAVAAAVALPEGVKFQRAPTDGARRARRSRYCGTNRRAGRKAHRRRLTIPRRFRAIDAPALVRPRRSPFERTGVREDARLSTGYAGERLG